ncbi:MAG: hypothetical protein WCK78_01065 [Paludibacter sp.]
MRTWNLYFITMFIFIISGLSAQTFEEYQKNEQTKVQNFNKEQNEGLARLQKEYADYVLKRDKEWTDYLLKEWENYQVFSGKKLKEKPKPQNIPVFNPPAIVSGKTPTVKIDPLSVEVQALKPAALPKTVVTEPIPQPVEPIRKPAEKQPNMSIVGFSFYGRNIEIPYDGAMEKYTLQTIDQIGIGGFWEKISTTNYTPAIEQLLQTKSDMNINDFGYFMIVQQFAKKLYPKNENTARLLSWFILVRSGYGVRVAYQNSEIALLIPTLQQVYATSFLTLNGLNYYIFPKLQSGNYFTYDKDYQAAGRAFDFNISSPVSFSGKKVDKTLSFTFEDKPYDIHISYDPDLVNFYKDYPLVDYSVNLNAAASVQAKESLAAAFKPLVAGLTEEKAVNLILHFVQTAFQYKTDDEQFGKEKFDFVDEIFYYPYSDCDDRDVLFTYLVREVLGLKVIGLEYPEHVAAAVGFTAPVMGDYLVYKNSKFVISDPTYVNAPVGLTMPQYKTASPQILDIKNRNAEEVSVDKIWREAQSKGCYKGSNLKNSKILPDGNILITGYFANPVQLGSATLGGTSNSHNCFVAKMNQSGETVWAKSVVASGNAVGMSVETSPLGNVIVAGVFTGSIRLGEKSISSARGKTDLFIASYSPSGDLQWLNRGGLETLPDTTSTAFSVTFSGQGVRQPAKHAATQPDDRSLGLFVDTNGGIFYSGMLNNALAVAGNEKKVAFASESAADLSDLLRIESDRFVAQQADKAIAGLMAAIRLVKFMGVSLTGSKIKEALDKNNPGFSRLCPNIYSNLGKINFVQNSKGVITILTQGGKDIGFDKVKVTNNSTISISEVPGGDYKLDVLSGIKVGKLVVWYNLNYIKMISRKGNLLFDYSSDHSQATVNVQKDILN